jgi:hypothetical protein
MDTDKAGFCACFSILDPPSSILFGGSGPSPTHSAAKLIMAFRLVLIKRGYCMFFNLNLKSPIK